jgi:hypothetical protein
MSSNFADLQIGVYTGALRDAKMRYPNDFRSIEGKVSLGAYCPKWK